jgi:hypothetical protein
VTGLKVGDPMPGGLWLDGTFCPPGLFRFVGYGETGTIVEGCPIFEPRMEELEPTGAGALTSMLMLLEQKKKK